MNSSKLTQAHVYIIGLVVAFILGIGLFFLMINPVQGQIKDQTTKNNGLKSQLGNLPPTEAVKKAQDDKKKAEDAAKLKEAQWRAVIQRQGPPADHPIPFGTYDRRLPQMAGWWTLPEWVARDAGHFARGQRGVSVVTDFKYETPSPDPNAVPGSPVVFPLGSMAAMGSFNQVLGWARHWNDYHFTPAVDGLALRLIGKNMVQATANLTLYVWTSEKPGAAPAGGDNAGGGGPMGMGMSGGPMGMGMSGGMSGGMGQGMGGGMGAQPGRKGQAMQ